MSLSDPNPALTWAALGIALASLIVAALALGRAGKAASRSAGSFATGGADAASLPDPDQLPQAVALLQAHSASVLRRVAVLRYDAFDDVTGRQSFSAALLDDGGDGLVLTSLANRHQTRLFVKAVQSLTAPGLTPEEVQAIDHAMRGGQ